MANATNAMLPFLETLKGYTFEKCRKDVVAGLTVAVVALPQSMAYAIIAGIDPVYGIYTAIISAIIGSLMGSSNHLITGPTNATSLLVASGMQRYLGRADFLEMIFLLTFIVGVLKALCGVMKLGRVVSFVSHSVIVGFTCGAGVIIALGQLNAALGIPSASGYEAVAMKVWRLLQNLNAVSPWTAAVSVSVVGVVLVLKRVNKSLPGPLIALAASIVAAKYLGLDRHGVKLTGNVPSSLPGPELFLMDYESVRMLIGPAIPIAIIGLVEAISISKSIASMSGQKVDANQEFIGQGVSNMVSAFFQCYPGSGSFTRSAINFRCGAITRLAGVFSGLFLALVLLFLAPCGKYIPTAALAAVIILIGVSMVNLAEIRKVMAAGRSDSIPLWLTFGATILMPDLDWAIYMGVFISVVLYLRDTNSATVRLLVPVVGAAGFQEKELACVPDSCQILTVHITGHLYFGVADDLAKKLGGLPGKAKVYILRLRRVTAIDITSLEVLDAFIRRTRQGGGTVLLCGVQQDMRTILTNTRLAERIGQENIFFSEDELFDSTRRAYERAMAIAQS
ncbi:MAG: hypothetical protein A3K19_17315 [Lentisphaerae bacterium RIFOXYB12_FULL_65_16]|nr:MAG: hypothetical protein A3K18_09125 [Lentisphaerae bacterium RIFOXYA12_64_32]OGV85625.1 MAG: hypothetical protein A3K19_17315 [Lentisphaerae bacterium RIFOXYB12_FULL_65_16]